MTTYFVIRAYVFDEDVKAARIEEYTDFGPFATAYEAKVKLHSIGAKPGYFPCTDFDVPGEKEGWYIDNADRDFSIEQIVAPDSPDLLT